MGVELDKLANDTERLEFVRLYHIVPHEQTPHDNARLRYFSAIIDFDRYYFESQREEVRHPQDLVLTILQRQPFVIGAYYGDINLPDHLVPEGLRRLPGNDYYPDTIDAKTSADLDTMTFTSFEFQGYMKRTTE